MQQKWPSLSCGCELVYEIRAGARGSEGGPSVEMEEETTNRDHRGVQRDSTCPEGPGERCAASSAGEGNVMNLKGSGLQE